MNLFFLPLPSEDVFNLIQQAFCHPVESLAEKDEAAVAEARLQCSQSALHQIDQILRSLVGSHMKEIRSKQFVYYA
jgi:hypothetical protein